MPAPVSPLPLWESIGRLRRPFSEKDAEAKLRLRRIDRCDPGQGLRTIDRPEPLTPTLSRSKSDISDFDNLGCPTRVNPSWAGEGAHRRLRTFSIRFQTAKKRDARTSVVAPSLRANGSRECAPDDRLHEAIHGRSKKKDGLLRRCAPRNDVAPSTNARSRPRGAMRPSCP